MKTLEQEIIEAEAAVLGASARLHDASRTVIAAQKSADEAERAFASHRGHKSSDIGWLIAKLALADIASEARLRVSEAEQEELDAEVDWEEAVIALANLDTERR